MNSKVLLSIFLFLAVGLMGCSPTLPNWQINTPAQSLPESYFPDGVAPSSDALAIEVYFGNRDLDAIEGLWMWGDSSFLVAIIRNDTGIYSAYDYLGVVVRANPAHEYRWNPGQVNLLLSASADHRTYTGANFGPMHDLTNTPYVLDSPNVMRMRVYDRSAFQDVEAMLVREYPVKGGGAIADSLGGESQGTCFLVSSEGVAVTNHHVIDGAQDVSVMLADGRKLPAIVSKQSSASDIALLTFDAETPDFLALAADGSTKIGDEVFTIGFPDKSLLGSDAKFTEGSVSALSGFQGDASRLQISVPIQPGNSGGPLVNHKGKVVGVIRSTAPAGAYFLATGDMLQNVNYAVKSEFVRPMLEDVAERPAANSRDEAISQVQKAVCQVVAVRR